MSIDLSSLAAALASHPFLKDRDLLLNFYTYCYAKTALLLDKNASLHHLPSDDPTLIRASFDLNIHHFACRILQALLSSTNTPPPAPADTSTVTPELLSNFAARIASLSPPANLPTDPQPQPQPQPRGWSSIDTSLPERILEAKLSEDLSDMDEELRDYLNGHGSGPDPSTDLLSDLDPYDGRDPNDQ